MDYHGHQTLRCFGLLHGTGGSWSNGRSRFSPAGTEINLYSMTRGVNRFKGLATIALAEIDQQYKTIPGLSDLTGWLDQDKALSNSALEQAIRETGSECLQKGFALVSASQRQHQSTGRIPEKLFDGAS